jgi:hypothetical protein
MTTAVLDEPVWVRVKITVKGDSITVDLQAATPRKGLSIPLCGLLRHRRGFDDAAVRSRPGRPNEDPAAITVITRRERGSPAVPGDGGPRRSSGATRSRLPYAALSKARPNRAMAAWGKRRGDYVSAVDPRSGQPYVRTTFDYDGSAGAVTGHDGPTGPLSIG